jgi:hypothetical protein
MYFRFHRLINLVKTHSASLPSKPPLSGLPSMHLFRPQLQDLFLRAPVPAVHWRLHELDSDN